MYMQLNLKQSQNQAEKLKKCSDVKHRVTINDGMLYSLCANEKSSKFNIFESLKTTRMRESVFFLFK